MPALVTTLRTLLSQADHLFESGRVAKARSVYEDLLERCQERNDRAMEVIARSMLARLHLVRHDPDAARDELLQAAELIDAANVESYGRYRAVLARSALADSHSKVADKELLAYVHWAEEASAHKNVVDACMLFAERGEPEQRQLWLQRGIDHALDHGVHKPLGRAYAILAALLDDAGEGEPALEAYQQSLHWHRRHGAPRQVVASAWAVGAVACRLEDWPLAKTRLDEAVEHAEAAEETCSDLLALALADLALVHEAAGDVVEARRLLLRSAALAREQDLARLWPERWDAMKVHAKRLELTL